MEERKKVSVDGEGQLDWSARPFARSRKRKEVIQQWVPAVVVVCALMVMMAFVGG